MGGAQPLAVTMNEGVCLAIEVDRPARAPRSTSATSTS
jgi:urocanate hydratase